LWSGAPRQRGCRLINQLSHDVSYCQDLSDSSGSLSRPNQGLSTLPALKPFDNFCPKTLAVPTRFIPFGAPFIQKQGAQGSADSAVSDSARHRNDVIDDLCLYRVLRVGLHDWIICDQQPPFGRPSWGRNCRQALPRALGTTGKWTI